MDEKAYPFAAGAPGTDPRNMGCNFQLVPGTGNADWDRPGDFQEKVTEQGLCWESKAHLCDLGTLRWGWHGPEWGCQGHSMKLLPSITEPSQSSASELYWLPGLADHGGQLLLPSRDPCLQTEPSHSKSTPRLGFSAWDSGCSALLRAPISCLSPGEDAGLPGSESFAMTHCNLPICPRGFDTDAPPSSCPGGGSSPSLSWHTQGGPRAPRARRSQ